MECDYLVVGAGFYGSVIAERIANDLNKSVIIVDRRDHIGGNCYSMKDLETGIEYHKYGSHIFHTSSEKAWKYISKFTEFNHYYHQQLAMYKGKIYQLPINLETINSFYNLNLSPKEARVFIQKEIDKENIKNPNNLEEKAISLIGRPLYEAFIKGYTIKQWNRDPKELPAKIITRLPVRYNYNEAYFKNARWQGIPLDGYTSIFERMLNSPNITIKLECDYFNNKDRFKVKYKTIYTGPIDKFFDYQYGKLSWRAIELKKEVVNNDDFQGNAIINYSDTDVEYTRIHEPKHLHPERQYPKGKTVIFYETSKEDHDEPYYPVNDDASRKILDQYRVLAEKEEKVIFGGRLGDYAYYDMDKTILAALKTYEEKIVKMNGQIDTKTIPAHSDNGKLIMKLLSCVRERRLPDKVHLMKRDFLRQNIGAYKAMLNVKTRIYNFRELVNFSKKSGKYLYVSPVGKAGKELLMKTIKKFGHGDFDYLIFVYDDTEFHEEIFNRCKFIREKEYKWQLLRKYATPEYCHKYSYIFAWDDDMDVENFAYQNFINIMKRNNLEIAQPALSSKSYYTHTITLQNNNYDIGRYTDFVEIMVPVFTNHAWKRYWGMINENPSSWGYGYDTYCKSICHYTNMGIIDCESVVHTKKLRGIQDDTHKEFRLMYTKNYLHDQTSLINYGQLH